MRKYLWYCLVPENELTDVMIRESALSLNPKADSTEITELERGLRVVQDRQKESKEQLYILKYASKFSPSVRQYPKLDRDGLENELERIRHVDLKHI